MEKTIQDARHYNIYGYENHDFITALINEPDDNTFLKTLNKLLSVYKRDVFDGSLLCNHEVLRLGEIFVKARKGEYNIAELFAYGLAAEFDPPVNNKSRIKKTIFRQAEIVFGKDMKDWIVEIQKQLGTVAEDKRRSSCRIRNLIRRLHRHNTLFPEVFNRELQAKIAQRPKYLRGEVNHEIVRVIKVDGMYRWNIEGTPLLSSPLAPME